MAGKKKKTFGQMPNSKKPAQPESFSQYLKRMGMK